MKKEFEMNRRISSVVGSVGTLIVVAVLLWFAFVTLPGMKCESLAQTMQRPFVFQPVNGCWIQTVQGNWQRVDQPVISNYQP